MKMYRVVNRHNMFPGQIMATVGVYRTLWGAKLARWWDQFWADPAYSCHWCIEEADMENVKWNTED